MAQACPARPPAASARSGLTVPLFAAVASFYGHGASPLAPRLMLLDEAFAGIDDEARAHCMGLIREFDLDFVITSEREWGCYAELPGVSICQLATARRCRCGIRLALDLGRPRAARGGRSGPALPAGMNGPQP